MLKNLFADMHRKYHITVDRSTGKLVIGEDCPPELFDELRAVDREYYAKNGKHVYANFESKTKEID